MFTSIIRPAKCVTISKSHPVESKIYCLLLLHYFVLITLLVKLYFLAPFCLQLSVASGSAAICTVVVYIARYSPPPPKKNHLNQNAFCLFYLQHLSETSLLSGRIERDIPQNAFRSPCKMPYIYFRFLTVLEEIRTKVCNIRFVENYSSWRRVISCGRTA